MGCARHRRHRKLHRVPCASGAKDKDGFNQAHGRQPTKKSPPLKFRKDGNVEAFSWKRPKYEGEIYTYSYS